MSKILIVDDETAIGEIVAFNLEKEGNETLIAYDGKQAIETMDEEKPDLVLLDVMMPVMDGFEALKIIREKYSVPIIMLTAKQEEEDKVKGLELGADDYIVKPFSMRELIARVNANLRRLEKVNEADGKGEIINIGDISLNLDTFEVKKKGKAISLTLREFELMKYFMQKPGIVFSRETLLKDVWGYEYLGDVRTVDVTIARLREKIDEKTDENYKYIITKRGIGYYFGG